MNSGAPAPETRRDGTISQRRQSKQVHSGAVKFEGALIDFLDQGRFQSALVIREQERHLGVVDAEGRERLVPRDLMMARYPERHADRAHAADAIEALRNERSELAKELDL